MMMTTTKMTTADTSARDAALKALSRRDYTAFELTRKLLEQDYDEESAQDAAFWLQELGYLDDEAYARGLMARHASKGYGLSRCRQDMSRRGIPADIAEAVLEEFPDSEARIDEILERSVRDPELPFRERQRLTGLLLRRGFDFDEIRDGLSRLGVEEF